MEKRKEMAITGATTITSRVGKGGFPFGGSKSRWEYLKSERPNDRRGEDTNKKKSYWGASLHRHPFRSSPKKGFPKNKHKKELRLVGLASLPHKRNTGFSKATGVGGGYSETKRAQGPPTRARASYQVSEDMDLREETTL